MLGIGQYISVNTFCIIYQPNNNNNMIWLCSAQSINSTTLLCADLRSAHHCPAPDHWARDQFKTISVKIIVSAAWLWAAGPGRSAGVEVARGSHQPQTLKKLRDQIIVILSPRASKCETSGQNVCCWKGKIFVDYNQENNKQELYLVQLKLLFLFLLMLEPQFSKWIHFITTQTLPCPSAHAWQSSIVLI